MPDRPVVPARWVVVPGRKSRHGWHVDVCPFCQGGHFHERSPGYMVPVGSRAGGVFEAPCKGGSYEIVRTDVFVPPRA